MSRCLTAVAAALIVAGSAARVSAACLGDCGNDGQVTVGDLILGVNIALDSAEVSQCSAMDGNGNGAVTIDELTGAVLDALNGCVSGTFAGDYSGTLDLGGRTGSIDLAADAEDHAIGSLVVDSAALVSHFARAITFPVAGFSAALSGSVNPVSGSFHVSGSFVDGNGQTVPVDISGTLPGPTGSVSVTAQIGTETFGGTLGAGTVMPTPTSTPGPSPTPITGGCSDGVFGVTFSNASDTNANTSALTLGKVTAVDQPDPSTGTFIWVISANVCQGVFGEVARGVVFQGIGQPGRIQPGTYAIASPVPPFLSVTYVETKFTFDPTQNFTHNWSSTGGTLVVEDVGGGVLSFHASGVTMAKGLVFQGATGTFTLDISGTIKVTHN